ncbi:MAG: RNA ligase family protein [Candidatus Njordarchaeales archaeon]
MTDSFRKYSKIKNLSSGSRVLEFDDLVIMEKLHGTNAQLTYSDSEGLSIGGRNRIFIKNGVRLATDSFGLIPWVNASGCIDKLKNYPDYTFYGEFYGPGINKGIRYSDKKRF